jgi:hypothetical protein
MWVCFCNGIYYFHHFNGYGIVINSTDWVTGELGSVPSKNRDTSHFRESRLGLWCICLLSSGSQGPFLWGWIGQSMKLGAYLHKVARLRIHGLLPPCFCIFVVFCLGPGQFHLSATCGGIWCLHLHILVMKASGSCRILVLSYQFVEHNIKG